ncbi:hypothetical protein VT84_06975 [Gemmata sp. SH-PL17]|uniref:hypothetical protein n=1 Tax=Gemmata sp. SH-PL17 TaxID=1630693 RepID=UPI00078DE769|nr:hypothetical protein [Gemmata sp. SH-PL17]AMV24122.1 hypothetical protein VT84_06975 [Gemmata sp. SH-PL17]
MTVSETACSCNHSEGGFTNQDLANLASIARGGPMDPHRFNVRAAEDFFAEHGDLSPAEAVVELLLQIRTV